jgi:hypothetical protein
MSEGLQYQILKKSVQKFSNWGGRGWQQRKHAQEFQCSISLCRLFLVYFTLLLHGIGTLMPWNMFITAKAVSL